MGKKMDVKTVQGAVINVITKSDAMIANSSVETADFEACNGAVHIMDKVIQPPGLCVFNNLLPGYQNSGQLNAGSCKHTGEQGCLEQRRPL